MEDCIFCKIVNGDIPKEFRYEDEFIVAFDDINPVATTHILFIPKVHVNAFEELTDNNVLNSVKIAVQQIVEEKQLIGKGYKIIINGGGAQVINHLHVHLIGPTGLHSPVN